MIKMTKKMTKKEARELLLKKRNSLTKKEVKSASESIIKDIDIIIRESKNILILGFMPIGNEIDLRELFERILSGYYSENYNIDAVLGLPRVCGGDMKFFRVRSLDNLERSKFGILEPKSDSEEIIPTGAKVLVPLIGVNKNNQRLGFGAGYYDRYFGIHKDNMLIGPAYDFQTCIDFEANEYDIVINHVLVAR